MQFSYTAKDAAGQEARGTIEAASKLEAADKLFNTKGLTVSSLEKLDGAVAPAVAPTPAPAAAPAAKTKLFIGEQAAPEVVLPKQTAGAVVQDLRAKMADPKGALDSINNWLIQHSGVPTKDKVVLFRLLATMIDAGLPLVKSLQLLSEQVANPRLAAALKDVRGRVEKGSSFSKALQEHTKIFNEAEIGIIASGEASGQLNKALKELADEAEKSENLRGKIKSAMIYPAVVLFILVGVVIVVMTLVVPQLSQLFESAGTELPLSTRILVGMSNWFIDSTLFVPNWLLFILFFVGIYAAIQALNSTSDGRLVWDRLMLRMPIFGQLHQKVALSAFTRQLASLSSSGLSIIRTLEITANAVGNEVYSREILRIRREVEKGVPIHQIIEGREKIWPKLVVSMIAVGEQTAQLSNICRKISQFYDEEVDTFVKNLSTIMEPLIIVIVGTLVGGLVAAIMQPIMNIADVASKAG